MSVFTLSPDDPLQLETLTESALAQLCPLPEWRDMAELERTADQIFARMRAEKRREAKKSDLTSRLFVRLDDVVRTERLEHLDEPDFPAEKKLRMVRALHLFNLLIGSYDR